MSQNIGKFIIDINSRKLVLNNDFINLTEKEINLILFLFNSQAPCNIEKLQKNVWGFKTDLETHTVETHVHRLRKKILNRLGEKDFIIEGDKLVIKENQTIILRNQGILKINSEHLFSTTERADIYIDIKLESS